jgi:hypothetical protein
MHNKLFTPALAIATALTMGACAWAATAPEPAPAQGNICGQKFAVINIEAVIPNKPFPYLLKPDVGGDEVTASQEWVNLPQRSLGYPVVVHCYYDEQQTQVKDFSLDPKITTCTSANGELTCQQ